MQVSFEDSDGREMKFIMNAKSTLDYYVANEIKLRGLDSLIEEDGTIDITGSSVDHEDQQGESLVMTPAAAADLKRILALARRAGLVHHNRIFDGDGDKDISHHHVRVLSDLSAAIADSSLTNVNLSGNELEPDGLIKLAFHEKRRPSAFHGNLRIMNLRDIRYRDPGPKKRKVLYPGALRSLGDAIGGGSIPFIDLSDNALEKKKRS